MCDFAESSQLHSWMFTSSLLEECRAKANQIAREYLATKKKRAEEEGRSSSSSNNLPPVESFAHGYATNKERASEDFSGGPWNDESDHPFVTPEEEQLLVSFYTSKLPSLVGPQAQVLRLRRESKVTATAAMFLRRFYLSNSVMIHDPKAVMVAAAFLATKVEDATADVRYLEDGTNLMNAPVTQAEILPAELALLTGINFQLLCFHPYKAVVALTEDLRTFLKSDKRIALVDNQRIAGEDLKPMYDNARAVLDDVIISDIPLLYTPGQIGLAALILANEDLQKKEQTPSSGDKTETPKLPNLDLIGYIKQRFSQEQGQEMETIMKDLVPMLRGLKEGNHGCANHHLDMSKLKGIHKKLKKCRAWGAKKEKKSKSKKRSSAEGADGDDEPKSKKAKKE